MSAMNAERWRKIELLYHAALEKRDPRDRAAFLDEACAGDLALRAEVESLLAHDPDASSLIETPAAAQLLGSSSGAAPREGTELGPYRLGALLGAGGMGEVYKAADTRLGRDVAIKVLPAFWSGDRDRRARLEREARAIAAVTHPHICALYDVGRDGDVEYLVLEYVEGETLAARLNRGAMPIGEALRVAGEMASALAAAHARGIVHRDLKPSNVVLTRSGAKLLDFGLARLGAPASSPAGSTNTAALTAAGTILGTLQYMSPEQVEGGEADARSDIFAFGAVLHEMISGAKAFEGKTQANLIAAILEREPAPLRQTRPETSPVLARLVRTCLAKDPAARWQSAADLERELTWLREDLGSTPAAVPPARRGWWPYIGWGVAAVAAAIAVVLAVSRRGESPAVPEGVPMVLKLALPADFKGTPHFPTISPDGRRAAFVEMPQGNPAGFRLWVRDLGTEESHPFEGTAGALFPFWSPDSRSLGFFAQGALKRIDLDSGSVQRLGDAPAGRGGAWAPDGTILFAPDISKPVMRISAEGGPATPATRLDPKRDRGHRMPFFLDDGKHFVFLKMSLTEENALVVGSLDSADDVEIARDRGLATQGVVAADTLFYQREGALVAQPLDLRTFTPRGPRVALVRRIDDDGLTHAAFSVSPSGVILYRAIAPEIARLVVLSRTGTRVRELGREADYVSLRLSLDGRKLAVERVDDPTSDISRLWVVDLPGGQMTPVTDGTVDSTFALWSRDGTRLFYNREKAWGVYDFHAVEVEGSRDETVAEAVGPTRVPWDWLPDGTLLYGSQVQSGGGYFLLWRTKPGSPDADQQIATALNPSNVRVSPDGAWIGYQSTVSGRAEIYIQGYPSGPRRQITNGGGRSAEWSADGRELYYLTDNDTTLNAVPVKTSPDLQIGAPTVLFKNPEGILYAPAPDGRTFYVAEPQPSPQRPLLTVLVNWRAK
jgi:serine/threonine protein kinase/Tol biopolymer transport system component